MTVETRARNIVAKLSKPAVEDASRNKNRKKKNKKKGKRGFPFEAREEEVSRAGFGGQASPAGSRFHLARSSPRRQLPSANRVSNEPAALCAHPRINFATKEVCGAALRSRFPTCFERRVSAAR